MLGNAHKPIFLHSRDSVFLFTDNRAGIRSQSEVKSLDKFCHVRHMLECPPATQATHFSDSTHISTLASEHLEAIFQACLAASVVVVISLFQNCCSCCFCCWPGSVFSFCLPRFLVANRSASTEKSSCWRKCVCDYLVMASNWVLCLFGWRGSVQSVLMQ